MPPEPSNVTEDTPDVEPEIDEEIEVAPATDDGAEVDLAELLAGGSPATADAATTPDPTAPGAATAPAKPGEPVTPAATELPAPAAAPAERTFTQAEIDGILGQRLARERERQDRELLTLTGKTREQLTAETRAHTIEQLQVERGLDEQTAANLVDQESRIRQYQAQEQTLVQERQMLQATRAYEADRGKFANDPLAKRYAAEIDQFSQNGAVVSYETALAYVKGQHAEELIREAAKAAEQRALANVTRRGKVAPESGSGAAQPTAGLSAGEKQMAAALGLSDAEYLAGKPKKR